jgi:transposase
MYIASIPNRKSPPAILLRESYREDGKVRTRTLANLTHWKPERIEALKLALKGEFDGMGGGEECGKIFGVTFALKQLIDQIGITRALGRSDESRFVIFMIIARIAHGGSRLSAVRWAEQHEIESVLGISQFDENDLYHSLDWLEQAQSQLEEKLYRQYIKKNGKPPAVVLYDVTSSYFEGEHNELATYGYNRDKKNGKKQIVIGLLTGDDGEPLAVRVFEGNTSDPKSVASQVELLKEQFGIEKVVFVGDRGMIKANQKAQLAEEKWSYITALTKAQVRKLINKNVLQGDFFDNELVEIECDDKRYILYCNFVRRDLERENRENKIKCLQELIEQRNQFVAQSDRAEPQAGLRQLQTWIKKRKLHSFITLTLNERMIELSIDEEAKNALMVLDGCYTLETTVDKKLMNTQTVNDCYGNLQKVERDFRMMKTNLLEVRPIFLRNARRTKAHVFLTMLALKVTRHFEKLLYDAFGKVKETISALTIDDALLSLSRLVYLNSQVKNQCFFRLPNPDAQQRFIFEALGIPFPKRKS